MPVRSNTKERLKPKNNGPFKIFFYAATLGELETDRIRGVAVGKGEALRNITIHYSKSRGREQSLIQTLSKTAPSICLV